MDIQIHKLSHDDIDKFIELISVFENVFEMENFKIPQEEHLMSLLKKEDFFVFAAISDNKIVGGLTAYRLIQYYSSSPLVFIYDIAIKTELQRQGIGKLLISNLADFCKDKSYKEMFVLADEVDEHAIEFYRSTGGTEQRVVNFNYSLHLQPNKQEGTYHP